jgi:hypothetical protein
MSREIFILGDFNRICDRCGFQYKASETRKEWTGLIVCDRCWEERHPQEFVRGVPDKQAAPEPRPDSIPNFSLEPIAYPQNYIVYLDANGRFSPILASSGLILYVPILPPLSQIIGD